MKKILENTPQESKKFFNEIKKLKIFPVFVSDNFFKTKNSNISNISFSIEIEAPKKVNGIDPIKYGPSNLRLMLPDLI